MYSVGLNGPVPKKADLGEADSNGRGSGGRTRAQRVALVDKTLWSLDSEGFEDFLQPLVSGSRLDFVFPR